MFLDIEYVIAVCECIIHFNEGYPFDKKYIDEGYIENYKDLLEECICLNESVFLKDKSIKIRKVDFDGENIWIGEWEEGMRMYAENEMRQAYEWMEQRYQGCADDEYVIRDGGGFFTFDNETSKADLIRQIEEKGHRAVVMTVRESKAIDYQKYLNLISKPDSK